MFIHQVWIGLLLADLGKGTDNGDEIVPLLLVLMMMLFEKGFPHLHPHAVIQVTGQFLLVQDQVCKAGTHMNMQPEDW